MAGRAIDKLRKAANLKSSRRLVVLDNGDEFEFWSTPLTMAQREKANRDAKSDDINQFALQLLLTKATDESCAERRNGCVASSQMPSCPPL